MEYVTRAGEGRKGIAGSRKSTGKAWRRRSAEDIRCGCGQSVGRLQMTLKLEMKNRRVNKIGDTYNPKQSQKK